METILSSEEMRTTSLTKINNNFTELNNNLTTELDWKLSIEYTDYIWDFNYKAMSWNTLKVVCFWDSITYWYDPYNTSSQIATTYPEELQSKLRLWYNNNNITVVNKWVSWDESWDLLSRYDADVLSESPDLVIQMIWTNDCNHSLSVNTFTWNLIDLAKKAYTNDIPTIFVNPIPCRRESTWPWNTNYRMGFFAEASRKIAEKFNMPFINMYEEFSNIFDWWDTYTVWDLLPQDETHPNQFWYKLIADIILSNIIPCAKVKWDKLENHIPIVSSQFWFSNITSSSEINSNSTNIYQANYILQKDNPWKYCRVAIFIWKRSKGLYLSKITTSFWVSVWLRKNWVSDSYSVDFYSGSWVYNVEQLLDSDINYWMYILEFNSDDFDSWDGDTSRMYPSAFIIK